MSSVRVVTRLLVPVALRLTAAALVSLAAPAWAQTSAVPDAGAGSDAGAADTDAGENRVPWHDSVVVWDNSVTTQTLGIGRDYQSRNPTYEMSFRLAPRYYFRDSSVERLSVRGDLMLLREFTDSDVTTQRGEWTFADSELWLSYIRTVRGEAGTRTDLVLRAPSLEFPTSNVSASSGKLLGLGLGIGVDQEVPLRGSAARVLPRTVLRARSGYTYQFVDTLVPTNDRVARVRLNPGGISLPSDQISGSAFPQHELSFTARAETLLLQDLVLVSEVGLLYARRYDLDASVEVCGVVATGCVDVEGRADATRHSTSTLFNLELSYSLHAGILAGIGYANLAPQLGQDGRRRGVFYSRDARASASLTFVIDALLQGSRVSGSRLTARAAAPSAY